MRISESALADVVARFLLQEGGQVFAEVASLGKSADLVLLRGNEVTFVEVKVNATSRAIDQCRAHELVADYVCVATATKSISGDNLKRLEDLGYGLISCQVQNRKCAWVLRPKRLDKHWAPIRARVVERMATGGKHGS